MGKCRIRSQSGTLRPAQWKYVATRRNCNCVNQSSKTHRQPWSEAAASRISQNALLMQIMLCNQRIRPCTLYSMPSRCVSEGIAQIQSRPHHSLSLALPVGSSSSASWSTTSSPAVIVNSALCKEARSSVFRGSTSSMGFNLALFLILHFISRPSSLRESSLKPRVSSCLPWIRTGV